MNGFPTEPASEPAGTPRFLRIHRATLVNLAFVAEVRSLFGGGVVKLKDSQPTELSVARDRMKVLKEKLGI
ncbi:MAG TPA: LytTR family DNA-binding domain-containing protein [Vicinamibacterales bacterium]|nr:LytTR family DNA-binding domain-containing protein [Vicinamibacterales bacterium]